MVMILLGAAASQGVRSGIARIVRGPDDQARVQAHTAGVPLKVMQPHEAAIAELYPTRFTLIRPDQHVAWRGNAWPSASVGVLAQVTGRANPFVPVGATA